MPAAGTINIELLVIGGGGAGGLSVPNSQIAGGGGGAGQAVYKPIYSVPTGSPITVVVGTQGVYTGTRGAQYANTADGSLSMFYVGPTNMVVASGGGAGGMPYTYGTGGMAGGGDSGYCGGGGAGGNYPTASIGGGGVAFGGKGYPGYGGFGCGGGGGGPLPQAGTDATATSAGIGGAAGAITVGGLPSQSAGGGGGGGSNGYPGGTGYTGGGTGGNPGSNGNVGYGYGAGGGGAGADLGYGTVGGNGTQGVIKFAVPTGTTVTYTGTSSTQTNGGNDIYTLTTNGTLTIGSRGGGGTNYGSAKESGSVSEGGSSGTGTGRDGCCNGFPFSSVTANFIGCAGNGSISLENYSSIPSSYDWAGNTISLLGTPPDGSGSNGCGLVDGLIFICNTDGSGFSSTIITPWFATYFFGTLISASCNPLDVVFSFPQLLDMYGNPCTTCGSGGFTIRFTI